ncbi:MAG: zinc ribbon domain-containing protein [Candidatus Omnitrophota bacterium]|nr:zinc ribbon domain-containing protein [Candidatus Omnitrophota bacterium]
MPTYEYSCDKCKKNFDLFQNMKDEPIKKCPKCGGKVHRLIGGGSGIIFKGTGFYETDYKKKKGHPHSDACKHCPSNKGKSCSKE